MKRFILPAIIGGIILYCWGFVAYMALPIYPKVTKTFKNEELVAQTLALNTSGQGVYFMPNCFDKEKERASSPLIMMTYVPSAKNYMGAGPFIYSFLIQLVVAFFLAIVAASSRIGCYFGRLLHLTFVGFAVSFALYLPAINWLGMDWRYAFAQIGFYTIGFFLAGLIIAALSKPKAAPPEQQY